jgi:hypothetical protein
MSTTRFIVRTAKYFIRLCVLCIAVIFIMYLADVLVVPVEQLPLLLFGSWKGWVLLGAIILLSISYPFTGFTSLRVEGDIYINHNQIVNALKSERLQITREVDGALFARICNPLRRLWLQFDDEICVEQYGQWIVISGHRQVVVRVVHRLESYLATSVH